mmetsp:Transcript_13605/g.23320  ORF Transcript_13605/g.23320 Transcript_13605/m.23320 type:complete len:231 (+) Transcript_13605:328-1020(+)
MYERPHDLWRVPPLPKVPRCHCRLLLRRCRCCESGHMPVVYLWIRGHHRRPEAARPLHRPHHPPIRRPPRPNPHRLRRHPRRLRRRPAAPQALHQSVRLRRRPPRRRPHGPRHRHRRHDRPEQGPRLHGVLGTVEPLPRLGRHRRRPPQHGRLAIPSEAQAPPLRSQIRLAHQDQARLAPPHRRSHIRSWMGSPGTLSRAHPAHSRHGGAQCVAQPRRRHRRHARLQGRR